MRVNLYNMELTPEFSPVLVPIKSYSCVKQKDYYYGISKIKNLVNDFFHLNRLAEEYTYALCFMSGVLVGMFEIGHGNSNSAHLGTREVFMRTLLCRATSVIIVHNHPSGDCYPSDIDISNARIFAEAGNLLGVALDDSIIVAGDDYFSFREKFSCSSSQQLREYLSSSSQYLMKGVS